ncbi:DUF4227 family protein [Hazenella sp. IB182357]|uniref:DUF4227 family protein n=1 Tax=Polycladospora coralii TaxID=2771432 RepID=A0A926RUY9_9BACL|nr:DUF4227 family protein [Polycladospora coralii]MBD1372974.1 DUF4227 family protein [Polycladospora coralii]
MIISARHVKAWVQFITLFIVFTLLLYQIMSVIAPFFKPDFLYEEPIGGARKVFAQHAESITPKQPYDAIKERLQWFYWLGE